MSSLLGNPLTDELAKLVSLAANGGLATTSRKDLERHAQILTTPHAQIAASRDQMHQIGETVRLMLIVRMSEESDRRALIVASAALVVAFVALVVSFAQLWVAYVALPHP